MFGRFTDRARRAVSLAKNQARSRAKITVDVQDILLGVLQEDGGVAANCLHNLGFQRQEVIDHLGGFQPFHTSDGQSLPFTDGGIAVFDQAKDIANGVFNVNYVGTEHLLLALLCDEQIRPLMAQHGVTYHDAKEEIMNLTGTKGETHTFQANHWNDPCIGIGFDSKTSQTIPLDVTNYGYLDSADSEFDKLPLQYRIDWYEARIKRLKMDFTMTTSKKSAVASYRELEEANAELTALRQEINADTFVATPEQIYVEDAKCLNQHLSCYEAFTGIAGGMIFKNGYLAGVNPEITPQLPPELRPDSDTPPDATKLPRGGFF